MLTSNTYNLSFWLNKKIPGALFQKLNFFGFWHGWNYQKSNFSIFFLSLQMLIRLRWPKGETRVGLYITFATLGEPLGTPHERLGAPEGPQNAPKWSKSGNFDLIFEKQEKKTV